MGDVSSSEARDIQLALLCAQLPRLRQISRGPVGAARRPLIDRALRAARAGEPVEEYLAELGLLNRPPVPEPEPDGRWIPAGGLPRTTLPTAVADDGPHAVSGEHVCPRGACSRRERRGAGEQLPVCEVFDVALRFEAES